MTKEVSMDEDNYSFIICKTPEEMKFAQDAELVLLEGLGNNILEHLGKVELGRSIKIFLQDPAGKVLGGVLADCFGGWEYISLLWVEKSLRNMGYGTKLMQMVEEEAINLGCTHAHVDTYSFESRPFYEKLGYQLFATLDDYPPGEKKYFLKKSLAA
jgi:GNAT superfamily N-acetyltransferase